MSTEPLRKAYSREEIIAEARAYMIATFGRPSESGDKEAWYGRLGMLVDFLTDRFPADKD